ncbi:MAG TPA: lipoprotein insertase outer membrane protein LolB [Coxiellaceae bacterium]|nr:lipoprotein insertase outer membrane protein LolB [Coxiellaceae bacterium]
MLKLLFTLLIVSLAACSTLPSSRSFQSIPPPERQHQLAALQEWSNWGVLSLQNRSQSLIASFRWNQQDKAYHIQLDAALNVGAITIEGEPGHVLLRESAKQFYRATSPEALMAQQLGWYLPISPLQFWIRGLRAPGTAQADYDEYGHLKTLHQEGWTIEYADYQSVGGVDLPQTLQLSQAPMHVKIRIKNWHLSSPTSP